MGAFFVPKEWQQIEKTGDRHTLYNVQSGPGVALGIFPGDHFGIAFEVHECSAGTRLAHLHQAKA
jgi:hypothetical protein